MEFMEWIYLGGILLFLSALAVLRAKSIAGKPVVPIGFSFAFLILIAFGSTCLQVKGVYEGYRLRNDSISITGVVQSSKHFETVRGEPGKDVEGYKIDVKFNDSDIEKVKTFETPNDVKKGKEFKLYHVPGTNISSLHRNSDSGSVWGIIKGLGIMIALGLSWRIFFWKTEKP
jgi:hypothetical protein